MDEAIPTVPCFLCKRSIRYGRDHYEGRAVREWKVTVCEVCLRGNHDGIRADEATRAIFEANNIAVVLDAEGRIPWPDSVRYFAVLSSVVRKSRGSRSSGR